MSQSKQCSAEGCEKVATHKGWCLLHYARWRRHGDPLIAQPRRGAAELEAFRTQTKQCARCAQDFSPTNSETEETWAKRRFCSRECSSTSPLGSYAIDVIHVKICDACGALIQRAPGGSWAQWDKQRCCSRRCASALGAQAPNAGANFKGGAEHGRKIRVARLRALGAQWAEWWEDQRRSQDRAEFSAVQLVRLHAVRGRGAQRIDQASKPRCFFAFRCACGTAWLSRRAQICDDGIVRCTECNSKRWRMGHERRAKFYGAAYELIAPIDIFVRDQWRCQICGTRTRGKYPAPKSPTIDHIVPLSRGGTHESHNLQTAHLSCNLEKGAGARDDQLRLRV